VHKVAFKEHARKVHMDCGWYRAEWVLSTIFIIQADEQE
jgi:hypothetical protein